MICPNRYLTAAEHLCETLRQSIFSHRVLKMDVN